LTRSGKFPVFLHAEKPVQNIEEENDVRRETTIRLTALQNTKYRLTNKMLSVPKNLVTNQSSSSAIIASAFITDVMAETCFKQNLDKPEIGIKIFFVIRPKI